MGMKHYPAEFKADAVALYRSRPGATINLVATDLGVNTKTLRNWIRAADGGRETVMFGRREAARSRTRPHNEHLAARPRGAPQRFTSAVKQLGSPGPEVRRRAVLALERIAHDSPDERRGTVRISQAHLTGRPGAADRGPTRAASAGPGGAGCRTRHRLTDGLTQTNCAASGAHGRRRRPVIRGCAAYSSPHGSSGRVSLHVLDEGGYEMIRRDTTRNEYEVTTSASINVVAPELLRQTGSSAVRSHARAVLSPLPVIGNGSVVAHRRHHLPHPVSLEAIPGRTLPAWFGSWRGSGASWPR
ncbi:transposase [Streptomyces sp. NPDC097727]|uniref:transposase n=1 Tax=Streptomyces sp. NPDC097727 TaxID=3366092 RepID=UPI00380F9AD7